MTKAVALLVDNGVFASHRLDFPNTDFTMRLLLLLLLLFIIPLSLADLQSFDLMLPHTSRSIHYVEFYLRGPGAVIDLSGLQLTAVSSSAAQDDGRFIM